MDTLGEAMLESFYRDRDKFIARWISEWDLSPLEVVMCESTSIEADGSTTSRFWFERKH